MEISHVGMLSFQIFMNIFSVVLYKGTEHPDLKVSLKYPFLRHFWSVATFSVDDCQVFMLC